MTLRGTLGLLLVLAVLVAYLWLPECERPAGPPLLSAPQEDVAQIEWEDGETRRVIMRAGDGWTDAAGRPWGSDAVTDLVEALATLRPLVVIDPEPKDPTKYGLGPGAPQLRLLDQAGRHLLALEIGSRNPAWTALYARLGGKPEVLLVGGLLRWELEKVRGAAPQP